MTPIPNSQLGKGLTSQLQNKYFLLFKELNFEEMRKLANHLMVAVSLTLSLDVTRAMESGVKIVHMACTSSLHPMLIGKVKETKQANFSRLQKLAARLSISKLVFLKKSLSVPQSLNKMKTPQSYFRWER